MSITLHNFTDLNEDEKVIVLTWRNNPSVKQWMYTSEDIQLDEHFNFIKKLKKLETKQYFLVKEEGRMIGVIYFTDIDRVKRHAEFGIYANPNLYGQGRKLMKVILDYAFNTLKLQYLFAEVFHDNHKAIELYKKFDFHKVTLKEKKILVMERKNDFR